MPLLIDAEFPGGNIVVEGINGDTVRLRQDTRDTEGDWFYWSFRVCGAAGRTLRFQFMGNDVFTACGPSVSYDEGWNWKWLGLECVTRNAFSSYFPTDASVHFALALPYTQRHLDSYLNSLGANKNLKSGILTTSRLGRAVEMLNLGRLDNQVAYKISITARAHSCETPPSYALEGLISTVLSNTELGTWYREHAELCIIPFLDKDGVELGDQGKNRKPHDHNRDFLDEPIYSEVKAVKQLIPTWAGEKWSVHLDLHSPCARGEWNEHIYIVGSADAENWQQQQAFAKALESSRTGVIPYFSNKSLPWGAGWNNSPHFPKTGGDWAIRAGVTLGASVEIPYAMCDGIAVSAENLRAFGKDLAAGLEAYLTRPLVLWDE